MEEDKRFAHVTTDPKFRRIPKAERKIKIDRRFKSMFNDKKFKVKYNVDKRGRPVSHTSSEDLKRYYELSGDESSESDTEELNQTAEDISKSAKDENDTKPGELNAKHKSDKKIPNKIKSKLRNLAVDYARGEGTLLSESSSDDEENESSESETEAIEHAWGELDRDAEHTEETTHRLAACNLDWDRVRAVDLMVLLNSFLPPGGLINSVTIYPSEFGLQRMKEEEVKGPTELVQSKSVDEEENKEEEEEGSRYHMEKLRQYQLNRLKYYYAVIDCDSESTANKIYTECDGLEYESSATKMDLRFIPNNMEFNQQPKEVCEKLPEPGKYQPRFFTTTALQQAKVDLTWDETDLNRIEIAQKLATGNVDDVADRDLQAYLASSSGEEESEEEETDKEDVSEDSEEDSKKSSSIDKYKALLQDIESKEQEKNNRDVEMEITWGINLKNSTEKLVKKKLNEKEEKTPFEQYLEKRKEKRKAKREEKKQQQQEATNSDSDIPSDIDMNNPYFAEEFNKSEFKSKNRKGKATHQESNEDLQEKAELELLLLNPDDANKKHFSLQKIQDSENKSKSKKKLKKNKKNGDEIQEDNFQVDVADERFSALYSSHHFNIDPTDPHYKKTKGMNAIVNEKLKRRIENSNDNNKKLKTDSSSRDAELSVLVKSVKRKTEALHNKKNKRQ